MRPTTAKKLHKSPFILTEQENKEMREAFNLFDRDGAGTIEAEEVRVALRVLGYNPTAEEMKSIVGKYDSDSSKHIDFDEFTKIILDKLSEPQPQSQVIRAFHNIDVDDDNMISLSDLVQIAEDLGENIDTDELREIIMSARGKADQFDIHTKDVGVISQSEFIRAIEKIYE